MRKFTGCIGCKRGKKGKLRIIIAAAAAAVFALSAAGCREDAADWGDTLPVAATEASVPTISYETEETSESTEPITFAERETTKRTAATESTPELATTTAVKTEETTEPTISTVPDVPKVPIAEFTSTTPINLAEAALTGQQSSESELSSQSSQTSQDSQTSMTGTSTDSGTVSSVSGPSEEGGVLSADKTEDNSGQIKRPYSYDYLTEKQKFIYDKIIDAAEQHKTTITFPASMGVTADDYCGVYQIIYDDEQAMFYLDTKMQYAVNSANKIIASATIFYKYDEYRTEEMQKQIDVETDKILAKITPDMTEYDKVKLFHDTLASMAVYDETADNCRDIYGVFVDKKAICGGYSKAFSYLCGKVGIKTATVTGDADGQPHMWNKVKIGGKWYNIDVTYAVASDNDGGYVRYDYFCVPDEMLAESRNVYEQTYEYPKAVFDDCSYYVKNELVAHSWEEVRTILLNETVERADKKEKVVQVKCADKDVYEDAVYYLFNGSQRQALDILEEALPYAKNKFDCSVINYNQDSTSLVIKLFLKFE